MIHQKLIFGKTLSYKGHWQDILEKRGLEHRGFSCKILVWFPVDSHCNSMYKSYNRICLVTEGIYS